MNLLQELSHLFPKERLKTSLIERHAYSCDASFYQLIPEAIVFPKNAEEIQALFQIAKKTKRALTFRTGGTSLSGQSVTEGILVDLSRYWNKHSISENGNKITAQPGITGATLNHYLSKFSRKIGPDPASIHAAMLGGILSNNSSGMCCGVQENSYHTLSDLTFILPDGKAYNSGDLEDRKKFEEASASIFNGILELRNTIINDRRLTNKIRQKYKIKNTVGYSLNAFLDFDHPMDILSHLLIGSEGTLAFIAEATLHTIPDKQFKRTGLLFFNNPIEACKAIPALTATNAEALELMDRAALRSVENMPDVPSFIKTLPSEACCILCEYQDVSIQEVNHKVSLANETIESLHLNYQTSFTEDRKTQQLYWKIRKGMYPSVAAVRKKGSSVMLEDIAVPVESLGDAILDLQNLFKLFNYHDAIVFGHAKEGNLHFLISQDVNTAEELKRFSDFNDALAKLIIGKYNGSLKAEHGTGRQIAPYVKEEWGKAGYEIMQRLKSIIDPDNILNPGVILNEDNQCHLKNIKSLPVVESEVDTCVECGYCEPSCPSRNYTLSPRQRIILRRSLARLQSSNDSKTYHQLLDSYKHYGLDTCAVDGLCAQQCPVHINTGDLVKRLRKEQHGRLSNSIANFIARNFKFTEQLLSWSLYIGKIVNKIGGSNLLHKITKFFHKIYNGLPIWHSHLKGPIKLIGNEYLNPDYVFMPACMSRMMGEDLNGDKNNLELIISLSKKADLKIDIPFNVKGVCCGQSFSSKGFMQAYSITVQKTIDQIWDWTKQGKIPFILDITSCTHSLKTCRPFLDIDRQQKFDQLTILDTIDFIADKLIPRLHIQKKLKGLVIHPVCAVPKMQLQDKLEIIAAASSHDYLIPFSSGCCGMAGDRGFYYPDLTKAATFKESQEIKEFNTPHCFSSGKPCEMSLSEGTGQNFKSLLYLMDQISN